MDVEQFSEEGAAALRESASKLAEIALRYASVAGAMRGRAKEIATLFELNTELRRTATDFNERVFDHTGTFALVPDSTAEYDDEEVDEDADRATASEYISIVSRWDIAVTDEEQLVEAGRAAHRRSWPDDDEADTSTAVLHSTSALHALLDEAGEPWYEIPGIEVRSGVRGYITPSAPPERYGGDPDAILDALRAPEGAIIQGESWA